MSQFCGSLSALTSRSGVTSPAIAGHAAVAAAPASRSVRMRVLMVTLPVHVLQATKRGVSRPVWLRCSKREYEQHGLVAHIAQLRREVVSSFGDRAQSRQDRNILLAVDLERH